MRRPPKKRPIPKAPDPIRPGYDQLGVPGFYQKHGVDYRNPHEAVLVPILQSALVQWNLDISSVLDLACGSGEVTLVIRSLGGYAHGIDPFTGPAYRARTGSDAEALTFDDIAHGALQNRRFSCVICSFALHLVPPSRLPALLYRLAQVTEHLLVITPHKRPEIKKEWGWTLEREMMDQRVRVRCYRRIRTKEEGG